MLIDLWNDTFSPYSSFGNRCMSAFIMLFILVMSCTLALLGFLVVDTVGVQATNSATSMVEVKKVKPPYTTAILVGKVLVPQYHPTSYWLHFRIDGNFVETSVEKQFFDDMNVGNKIKVDYGFTRLSRTYKPTHIALATN
jgi:hypothetical protein